MRYFFIILILAALNSNAQTAGDKGKITGKVTDSGTRQPVDYATVSLFKQGSTSPFNGISTDPKGDFIIGSVPAGDYRLTIDFLGYKRYTAEHVIVTDGGTMALGIILLQPVQNQLKGVEIVAKAPVIENRIDKMVYNAQNDLTAQSGAAIDVLKKVPQVTVDIDGNVELQGNANIRFLINGKPSSIFGASLADALQAIPGSQIKSIEVITSPGAKYDAAGTGGIINIILKDNKVQGINGSVNLTAATRQENGSFNLNARKGNFGVNAFFSGNAQLNTTVLNTNNRTSTGSNGDVTRLFQQGSADTKRSGYQSGLNFNWSITPKDELTASVGFDHFGNHSNGITSQQQTLKDFTSGDILSDLISLRNSDSRFSAYSTDLSLSYKKNFKKEGQELDFLVTTSNSKNTANYLQTQDYLNDPRETTGIRGNNPGNDRETNISIDYTHPITKTFTIEGGAKAVIEDLKNTTVTDTLLGGNYVNNADQSYTFNYKRNIYAAYLSTSSSLFNKFLDVKLGLRNEYTTTSTDFSGVTIPGYNTLAPSAVISHKIGGTQSIKLSYSYRIERPDYGEINPFYNISDPNNISTGNPNLKPEKSNSFELGYNRSFNSGANFYIGSFYRHNTDDIQQFAARYDELDINGKEYTNVLLTQRANLGIQASLGGNIFISVPVTSKLNLRSNMFLVQRTNKAPGIDSIKALQYRVNLNASYQFAGNFMAEAFGNYNSSTRTLQGNRPKFFFYTMAVRKQFWDKKASIGLVANNAFSRYINQESVTRGPGFNQSTIRQLPFRSFGITLSYKFGKLEFSKEKEKEGHEENGNLPAESAGR
ncbi:TonB-dependent receptor [Mucilaginibacter phyllosphaerae]|uniref:Outer membrane receptor protein involved in Fe transport n=1 Tax=Mucilaginibacter phyllosphaerae TaxID=1812349 RepID=A0A4Y8AFN6_9SPHI|nr:TonB-dependent receptor [Mucilaginibacter phyllosphaerae]MBB3968795.1 outer membrane receptor protein involved in Fe transport [Mucilaginibacter phyllosphaerae]TEW67570.1 TonB-dependent receptor [Mucilaginibacter phyllosphaerae]GGH13835.1 TonB-dependent receptor [Mucilaginibacter phyllosphaerae]